MLSRKGEACWPQSINIIAVSILTLSFIYGFARPINSGNVVGTVGSHTTVISSKANISASKQAAPASTTLAGSKPSSATEKKSSLGWSNNWVLPVKGTVSSAYGWRNSDFHHGIDIAVPSGTWVRAARAGRVAKVGWLGVYGLAVLVDHGGGVQSLYAHNSRLLVKVGEYVESGEGIAYSGNTGNTTGPHLHFEIRVNGRTIDPTPYLPKVNVAWLQTYLG